MKKITFLILSLFSFSGFAQWTDNYDENLQVVEATSNIVKTTGTLDGQTYVSFWEFSDGYEPRVQLLNQQGEKQFGSNGILVNDTASMSSYIGDRDQVVDTEGNLYVAFRATGDGNGYVNKISKTGEQLYGNSGIIIPGVTAIRIMSLADGGVIISWMGASGSYLMRYNNNGEEVWNEPLKIVSPSNSNPFTVVGEMANMDANSFVALLHTTPTSYSGDAITYLLHFDLDGNALWADAPQISSKTLSKNKRYQIKVIDHVVYIGYHGATGFRYDSFLQKVNADGELPWGENGVDFALDDTYYEMETSIGYEKGSDYIWSVARLATENQGSHGTYIQKFNKETGQMMLGENAKEVFPISTDGWVSQGDLQIVNHQPFILFTTGIPNGYKNLQLGVTLLDEKGNLVWEDKYKMISTVGEDKMSSAFTSNVEGQSVAIWAGNRNEEYKIYAQNFVVENESICVSPIDIQVDEVTVDTAKISWTPQGEEESWEVIFGEEGFDLDTEGETKVVFEPLYVLKDLNPSTHYQVYVRSICEENEFSDWSEPVVFETGELGIEKKEFINLKLYPNPVDNFLNVQAEMPVQHIKVFDMLGRQWINVTPDKNQSQINLSALPSGMYLLTLQINNLQKSYKILKK